jgi:phytoene synthase
MSADAASSELHAQVARSSFYAGMRILPKPEREGMYAIYAFCRQVDDIADDLQGTRADRAAALMRWHADIDALHAGRDAGEAAFLAPAVARFALDPADFHAVLDGMMTDVEADVRWPEAAALDLYCDRVASAVGRLSRSLIISAARCSSPISCAISTRMRRSAASICRPRRCTRPA